MLESATITDVIDPTTNAVIQRVFYISLFINFYYFQFSLVLKSLPSSALNWTDPKYFSIVPSIKLIFYPSKYSSHFSSGICSGIFSCSNSNHLIKKKKMLYASHCKRRVIYEYCSDVLLFFVFTERKLRKNYPYKSETKQR